MVSPTSDKSRSKFPNVASSFSFAFNLLNWLAIVCGCVIAFCYANTSLTGAEWADRTANGSAACVAIIYIATCLLVITNIVGILLHREKLRFLVGLIIGLVPFVLLLWNYLAIRKTNETREITRPVVLTTMFGNANQLGHSRLFGGSFIQKSVRVDDITIVGSSDVVQNKKFVEEIGGFIQFLQSHLHSNLTDAGQTKMYIQTSPILDALTSNIASWILVRCNTDSFSKVMGTSDWRNCAIGLLDSQMRLRSKPPQFLLDGWAEYWSLDTDTVLQNYFEARNANTALPTLNDLLDDRLYGISSNDHRIVGATFVAFIIEKLEIKDFLRLCDVHGREDFINIASEVLNLRWAQVDEKFDQWLRREAERLDWDRDIIFVDRSIALESDRDTRADQIISRLKAIRIQDSTKATLWSELVAQAARFYRLRTIKNPTNSFERTAVSHANTMTSLPIEKRTRALITDDGAWYSRTGLDSEEAIVVTSQTAYRATRTKELTSRTACSMNSDAERRNARRNIQAAVDQWWSTGDFLQGAGEIIQDPQDWKLASISNGGDSANWEINLSRDSETGKTETVDLLVAPQNNYRIISFARHGGDVVEKIERNYKTIGDDWIVSTEEINGGETLKAIDVEHWTVRFNAIGIQKAGSFREELAYVKVTNCAADADERKAANVFLNSVCGGYIVFASFVAVAFSLRR